MENYIVRVKSYVESECLEYGTGIIIEDNLVLTAKHVVCGQIHKIVLDNNEINAVIVNENDTMAILKIEESCKEIKPVGIFTTDEIFDEEAEWSIQGYITSGQIKHSMSGQGVILGETEEKYWDYYLLDIIVGKSQDYSGLSGSPVFCNNRIIGILQMQSTNINGNLGVRISSVNAFKNLLFMHNFQENECKLKLKQKCLEFTNSQLEKNIRSKKYIPDIYIEEHDYKEFLRYFADPYLFLKKAINDVMTIDLSKYNFLLNKRNEKTIDFHYGDLSYDNFNQIYEAFTNEVIYAEKSLEILDKDNHSEGDLSKFYDVRQNHLNNSVKFLLGDIKNNLKFISKRYLLLTKDAGQGKTNFLCDFTQNFLMKKNYFVLYYNAYEFREEPFNIVRKQLETISDYSIEYIFKILDHEWASTKKPFIIIIDGLNENTLINGFGLCIKEFLEECKKYPFIKVIMTTRNELLDERFSSIKEGSYLSYFEHINMWSRSDAFKERIFRGYLKFFNITVREGTLRDSSYKKLTDDVLLLRFFCEVYEGKKQIYLYDVYKYDVFDQYLAKKAVEYNDGQPVLNHIDSIYSLLNKISKHMIDNRDFFNVPSSIFDEREQEILVKMLYNDVIFKDELNIKTGMLVRSSIVISFTFDEFRDFCITNYILINCTDGETFYNLWNDMNNDNFTIREGVLKYIFYLARTKSQDDLLPILKKLPEYEEMYWSHIWGLEDKYLGKDDVDKWKLKVHAGDAEDKRIVYDLLMKFDCEYFKNININILFEILDEISVDNQRYIEFINKMFEVYIKPKYSYWNDEPKAVWPYNYMLDRLGEKVYSNKWNEQHWLLYKLTIYLMDLEYYSTEELWENLYITSPKIVIKILKDMNNHSSNNINGNVKEILKYLGDMEKSDEYSDEIKFLYEANTFSANINFDLSEVLKIIFGDEL